MLNIYSDLKTLILKILHEEHDVDEIRKIMVISQYFHALNEETPVTGLIILCQCTDTVFIGCSFLNIPSFTWLSKAQNDSTEASSGKC